MGEPLPDAFSNSREEFASRWPKCPLGTFLTVMTPNPESIQTPSTSPALQRLAQIMGCKWSMGIIDSIARDITRPGRIQKELDGISTKVLHRCINRLESEGFLTRQSFDEIPPRVEYQFSAKGQDLLSMIRQVQAHADRWRDLNPMEL